MSYKVDKGRAEDLQALTCMRARMFAEFWDGEVDLRALAGADAAYFGPLLERGEAAFWLVRDEAGEVVASAAVAVYGVPPKPWALAGRAAYVCSMYTDPAHRRRGLARRLLGRCLDFAGDLGLTVLTLHASPMGRPLYEGHGFTQTNEMRHIGLP